MVWLPPRANARVQICKGICWALNGEVVPCSGCPVQDGAKSALQCLPFPSATPLAPALYQRSVAVLNCVLIDVDLGVSREQGELQCQVMGQLLKRPPAFFNIIITSVFFPVSTRGNMSTSRMKRSQNFETHASLICNCLYGIYSFTSTTSQQPPVYTRPISLSTSQVQAHPQYPAHAASYQLRSPAAHTHQKCPAPFPCAPCMAIHTAP